MSLEWFESIMIDNFIVHLKDDVLLSDFWSEVSYEASSESLLICFMDSLYYTLEYIEI